MSGAGSAAVRLNGHEDRLLRQDRERLATFGASVLSEQEVLALALGGGALPECDAHPLAGRLLARFGSVRAIGRVHPMVLAGVPELGMVGAAQLTAAFELARRASAEEPPARVATPEDVVAVVEPLLVGHSRERLVVVICDRVGRVLGTELLSQGSADRSLLPIREVVVAVLRRDGQTFALAHNHPSGDPTPSRDDIEGMERAKRAAGIAGVRLLWHVVVGDEGWDVVAGEHSTGAPAYSASVTTRRPRMYGGTAGGSPE